VVEQTTTDTAMPNTKDEIEASVKDLGQRPIQILSVIQALEKLGIGRTKFYALLNSGHIKALKLCRRTVVTQQEIERFIASLPQYRDSS
jgi:predicted DNA-binding transcriptional regulator AlpA